MLTLPSSWQNCRTFIGVSAMTARSLFPILALTAMVAVPSSAASLADYNVEKADTWADALAICDVTKFLLTEPNLNSEAIIAPVPGGSSVALYRPLYIPPSGFFSDAIRDTFEMAKKSGQVTLESYSEARKRYAQLMLAAYHGSLGEQTYLADRMRLCYALAADTTGRTTTGKKQIKH